MLVGKGRHALLTASLPSPVLVTALEPAVAESHCRVLASHLWQARRGFCFGVPTGSMEEIALAAAQAAAQRRGEQLRKPVVISDSGDNPTAGGVGDVPAMLEVLLRLGVRDAVIQVCWWSQTLLVFILFGHRKCECE